jgi:hypothetical protein
MHDTDLLHLQFDAFELDERDARLSQGGRPVSLPRRAFGVLCALARQPGQLVTKNALLDAVWGRSGGKRPNSHGKPTSAADFVSGSAQPRTPKNSRIRKASSSALSSIRAESTMTRPRRCDSKLKSP